MARWNSNAIENTRNNVRAVVTMYLTTDSNTKRLKSDATNGEFVEFSENGTVQVTREVGEQMCKHYDAITEKDN